MHLWPSRMGHNNAKEIYCCICTVTIVRWTHQNYINASTTCLVNVIWRPWWMYEMSVKEYRWNGTGTGKQNYLDENLSHSHRCAHSQARSQNWEKQLLASSCLFIPLSIRLSVLPHRTTRLLMDGFPWNLIFDYFLKICLENSGFIKILQEYRVVYMQTNVYF